MPAEQPNTRRIEQLQKQIEQAKNDGQDTTQLQAELDQLQNAERAQTQSR